MFRIISKETLFYIQDFFVRHLAPYPQTIWEPYDQKNEQYEQFYELYDWICEQFDTYVLMEFANRMRKITNIMIEFANSLIKNRNHCKMTTLVIGISLGQTNYEGIHMTWCW